MANINLHDEDGNSWITNRGEYRMPHPSRPGLAFEPGQPTKVNTDAWIEGQPVLAVTDMLGANLADAKADAEQAAEDKQAAADQVEGKQSDKAKK